VRYAAEAAAPVVGKQARAFAHAAADLQDVLGDLNDAVAAAGRLDEWATQHRGEDIRGAEELAALERAAAVELRGRWRPVWEELAAPKFRAWM
jgi:CHAD domain-containing protein